MLTEPLRTSSDVGARSYDLHGVPLAVRSDSTGVIDALAPRLRYFAAAEAGPASLRFGFHGGADDEPRDPGDRGALRSVYDLADGEVLYDARLDRLHLGYRGAVRVTCEPAAGLAHCTLDPSVPELLWPATHLLFMLPLMEMLKRRGVYGLHAAALSAGGRGLLLAGGSGAGKSTLALALLRGGFNFLGDDMCFLVTDAVGPRVLSFPDEIDVAEGTAGLFPELHFLLDRPLPPGARKHPLLVEEVYGVRPVAACRPAVLVFPRVAHAERSVLTPMDPAEALLELVPNVLLTEPRASQAHLDTLASLAERCRCYRLATGSDLERLPALFREVLDEAQP
jgi:hypothetical protein